MKNESVEEEKWVWRKTASRCRNLDVTFLAPGSFRNENERQN